jgi:ABC-type glycerol-3-phosphate transport system substrate-binding protein
MKNESLSRRDFLKGTAGMVGLGLLAACAPQTTPAPAEPESSEPEPEGEPAQAGGIEGEEFLLWGLEYDPHIERYHMLADAFKEETGATAIIEPQAWPLETKIISAMAAGTVPDVTCVMGKQLVPLLLEEALTPVDDLVFDAAGVNPEEIFYPDALGAYFYDGRHWGVPLEAINVGMSTGVRTDWVEEIGDEAWALLPPLDDLSQYHFESFENLWQLAEMLQQTDDAGNVTVWGLNSQGWDNRTWMGIMRDLGREWWDSDNKKFYLNSEEAVEALQIYCGNAIEAGIEGYLEMHHMNALLAGSVAIGLGNHAMAGEAEKIDVEVEQFVRPPVNPGEEPKFVSEGGWGFEVPVQAEKKEVGIEWLKWMCTYDALYIYSGIYGGVMPSSIEVSKSDIYQGDDRVKRGTQRDLKVLPNTVYYGWGFGIPSEMETITAQAIDSFRIGDLTAKEACDQMQQQMEEHYEQFSAGEL